MTFFARHGTTKPITTNPKDYLLGDIVCWNLGGSVTHIGIVVKKKSADGQRHLIVHNIGGGQVIEDCLFKFKIIGHYRYKKRSKYKQPRHVLHQTGFHANLELCAKFKLCASNEV